MITDLRSLLRAPDELTSLDGLAEDATPLIDSKSEAKEGLSAMVDELFDLHEMMFAAKERAVLLVLQGTDASGKNGTIKHVVGHLNPAGVTIASFTEPTEEERDHHFLWRIRQQVPPLGHLGVFDRSHYEDLLVPMAEATLAREDVEQRFKDVLEFEHELTDSGVVVVKCLLHLSYDEQRRRFLRRLRRADKQWKFAVSDLETRKLWDEYRLAYRDVVARTSTPHAPWYIVPADYKWYRNWAVARILVETWREMGVSYPRPDLDLDALRSALEAPS